MIRKLMASCAVAALMSSGAFTLAQAQSDPAAPVIVEDKTAAAPDSATTAAPATEQAATEEVLTPEQPTLASVYIGRPVYSSADPESDNIGDVNDLIVSEDGAITHAVVGVGGFLGIGEKDVAVPFDKLEVVERDGDIRLIYAATREELEAAPALDRTAFDPVARFQAEQSAAADTSTPIAPAPAGDLTAAPSDQAAVDSGAPALADDPAAAPTTDNMAAAPAVVSPPAEQAGKAPAEPGVAADQMATDAPAEMAAPAEADVAATAPADVTTPPAEPSADMAAAPDAAAPDAAAPAEADVAATAPTDATTTPLAEPSADVAAAPDAAAPAEDMTVAPAEDNVAASTAAEPAATTPAPSGDVSFVTASADQMQASDLMGKAVLNAEQESIGEISDLMLEKEGKSRVALIDVGGFLGVGEKTVGVPFDQLQISKAVEGSEQVTVAMSKEQLEQLPAIVTDTAAAGDAVTQDLPAAEPSADQTAATPPVEPATTEQPADTAQAPATDEMTTGSITQPVEYAPATQDVAASKLIGAVVYGPEDANLGEVSDLVFTKTGDIEAAVIDVGGFLGMGEKPVALEFGALNIRTDENGAVTAMVDATQEQLDQAPTFEEPEQVSVQ